MDNLIDLKKKYSFKELHYKDNNFLAKHGSLIINNLLNLIKIKFRKILIIEHNNKNKSNLFSNTDYKSINMNGFFDLDKKFDLIIANFSLGLEFNIDPDKYILNIYKLLEPSGLVILNLLNESSFYTIKKTFIEIDESIYGGAYQRFGPFNNTSHILEILQKNKFKEVIATNDSLEVNYNNLKNFRMDLKQLGFRNLIDKKPAFNRDLLKKAEVIFKSLNNKGKFMPIEFEISSISAWK